MKKDKKEKLAMEGLKHLPEKQFDKLIKEEPEITIKGYLLFLREIADIEKSIENGIQLKVINGNIMNKNKENTIDDFYNKYTLIENHLTKHGSFENKMFETYDKELEFVRSCDPKRIWTVIDCDGWFGVTAGYHWVNRIGYLITKEEWESDTEEFVICDEGPVNDWFNDLDTEEQKKVFGDSDLKINNLLNIGDQLQDTWNNLCVDEKEELMENFKNKNNGL